QADRSGRLDHGKVEVAQVIRAAARHRGDVQIWTYGLRVGALMAGHFRLGDGGVDHPVEVRLPGIGGAAHEHRPGPLDPTATVQRMQHPDQGGRVARDDPGKVTADGARVVGLRDKGVTGQLVRLATLPYRLDPGSLVPGLVLRADILGRAVDHDVHLPQQVVERAGDGNAGR